MDSPATKRSLLSRLSPRTCLFAAVVALTFALTTPAIDHIDGIMRVRVAENLLQGQLTADTDPVWSNFYARGSDGQSYTVYGLGQPLVFAPLVGMAGVFGEIGGKGRGALIAEAFVVLLYTALINLALAAALYGVLRQLRLPERASAVGTLLLLVLTPWLIWGRSLQEEALTAALLLGAFLGMLRWRSCACPWWLLAAGLMAGYTANVRPNAVFMVGALFAWFVISQQSARLKSAALFLAGSVPSLVLFFWWNAHRFGSPLKTGWQASGAAWSFDFSLFANLLVLPDYGLLWFAPLLILLPLTRQRMRLRLLAGLMAGAFVVHAILLAGMPQYVGHAVGVSWGPRYLMHGALLAGPLVWLGWLKLRKSRLHRVGLALIVLSAVVQWAGLWFQPRLEYSQDEYRTEQGLSDMQPHPWLLRRFSNIVTWISGDLDQYSFPKGKVEGADILMTPDLPPLRISASSRLEGGGFIVVAAWGWFIVCLGAGAASSWLMVRRD